MRLPKGRKDWRRPRFNYTKFYLAKHDPNQTEFQSKQSRFINQNSIATERVMEVNMRMKIPENAVSQGAKSGLQFLKAPQLGLPVGSTLEFTIAGEVEVSERESGNLYSVPVGYVLNGNKMSSQYSLNKSTLRTLVTKLGDETSTWIGARFTGFVAPTRNPQTGAQTTTLVALADSVKTAKSR